MMLNIANVFGSLVACLVVCKFVAGWLEPKRINIYQSYIYDDYPFRHLCLERYEEEHDCGDCAKIIWAPFYLVKNEACETYFRGKDYKKIMGFELETLPTDEKHLKKEESRIGKNMDSWSKNRLKAASGSDNIKEKLDNFLDDLECRLETEIQGADNPIQLNHLQAFIYDDHKRQGECSELYIDCHDCAKETGAPYYHIRGDGHCRTYTRGEKYLYFMRTRFPTCESMKSIEKLQDEKLIVAIEVRIGTCRENELNKRKKRKKKVRPNEGTSQAAGGSDNTQGIQSHPDLLAHQEVGMQQGSASPEMIHAPSPKQIVFYDDTQPWKQLSWP